MKRSAHIPHPLASCATALLMLIMVPTLAKAHLSIIRQGPDSRGSIEAGDHYGQALAVGDFNNDGYDDLAIGAPGEDVGSAADAGSVVVCFGSATGVTHVGAQLLRPQDIGQTEVAGAQFGYALAAGDFNHDGFDDLVIGAPFETVTGHVEAGRFYVVFGSSSGLSSSSVAYDESSANGAIESGDRFGWCFAVGNFNGDPAPYADLAVGAPGEDAFAGAVAVNYIGGPLGLATGFATFVKQSSFGSANVTNDQFGFALAAGNFMATTYDDLAIGTPFREVAAATDAGIVYLVQGGSSGLFTSNALVESAGDKDAVQTNGDFGFALACGQFFSGSYRSVAIGEPGRTVNGLANPGRVIVAKGIVAGLDVTGTNGRILNENSGGSGVVQSGDGFGKALAAGEYYDSDGYDDLAVGAPNDGLGFTNNAGQFQIFPGGANGPTGSGWSEFNQATCNEPSEYGDYFGASLAFGRFDATNRGGFAVGAPGERYEKVYGVASPTLLEDAGVAHVVAPWRQVFGLSCQHSVVYDCNDNLVFSQDPFEQLKIGSTTKIMTVLLACEHVQNGFDPNTAYTVPGWVASNILGSQVPLIAGESLRLIDLMNTCLMLSGNDAAHAIADVLYGPQQFPAVSITVFVAEMNQRASQLGMTHTHFNNPAGLDTGPVIDLGDPYSTPEDMAKLSRAAMANPLFAQIAGTLTYNWTRLLFGGAIIPTTTQNIFSGVIAGIPNGTGIKGGCTSGAQATGCFSSQSASLAGTVIAGHFTTPLINNTCDIPVASYVKDAASLTGLGLASCNVPFLPLAAGDLKYQLIAANLPTLSGERRITDGELLDAAGPVVDVFRQQGTGVTSLDFEIGHVAEIVVDPSAPATFGITPFEGHGDIVISNQDSVPGIVDVTPSTTGTRTRYAIPGFGAVRIPAYAGPPVAGFTLTIDDADATAAELTVEIPYQFHLTSPGPDASPFFTARPRRPPTLSDVLWLSSTGTDRNGESMVFASAHSPGLTVGVGPVRKPPGSSVLAIHPAVPNPFRDRTRIAFDLAVEGHVSLAVYDLAGRRVRHVEVAGLRPGSWGFDWDGTRDGGARASAGVYFYRMQVDGREAGSGHLVMAR